MAIRTDNKCVVLGGTVQPSVSSPYGYGMTHMPPLEFRNIGPEQYRPYSPTVIKPYIGYATVTFTVY